MLPARLAAHRQQGDTGLRCGLAEGGRLGGRIELDGDGGGSVPAARPQRGERGTAPGPDGQNQLPGTGQRRILGVEQGDATDLHIQPRGGCLQLHQRLPQRHQQLAQTDTPGGWRCRGNGIRIHDRRLCWGRVAWAHMGMAFVQALPDDVMTPARPRHDEHPRDAQGRTAARRTTPTVLMLSATATACGGVARAAPGRASARAARPVWRDASYRPAGHFRHRRLSGPWPDEWDGAPGIAV